MTKKEEPKIYILSTDQRVCTICKGIFKKWGRRTKLCEKCYHDYRKSLGNNTKQGKNGKKE